ncbi:MAG: DUF3108 domain-containing protein [Bacteroidota bacterium]|nr:DUF3108 domain-containing protein [Bacteroidota bacterium]MDP4227163.1 DUF3108 domain-containing protein [Bacteroidota bacterium]MDP4273505.1 DUF3108 domain-containing protein [Bacteroidota bacterium]
MKKKENILKKNLLLSCLILFYTASTFAQYGIENKTFNIGERVTYDAYYNWKFVWVRAGVVEFKVGDRYYMNRHVYDVQATGSSLKSYDWMFKVRENFRSYIDIDSFRPLWFQRDTYEGGYKAFEEYFFDHRNKKIISITHNSKRPYKKDQLTSGPETWDALGLVYYTRNLDFSRYKYNEKIPVQTVIDNEVFNLYIRYLGKEDIITRDKKKYHCYKFSVKMIEGTIFKGGEDLRVWVTDDANRIPVLVEAKILIGSVKAVLTGTYGLRH